MPPPPPSHFVEGFLTFMDGRNLLISMNNNPIILPPLPNHCDGCGVAITRLQPNEPPTLGMSFDISGSYNGFVDRYDADMYQRSLELCHDCVIKMITLFPEMGKKLGKGCHSESSIDEAPCCAHAFTFSKDLTMTMVPNESLTGWVPLEEK